MGEIIRMLVSVLGYQIVYGIIFYLVMILVKFFFEKEFTRLIIGCLLTIISWHILYGVVSERITIKWLLIVYMIGMALSTLLNVFLIVFWNDTSSDSEEKTVETVTEAEQI